MDIEDIALEDDALRQVVSVLEGQSILNEGAEGLGYVLPLLRLSCKSLREAAQAAAEEEGQLSPKVLRLLHRLYREREASVLRREEVWRLHTRITRYNFGWTEAGTFKVWGAWCDDRSFEDADELIAFLNEIEHELLPEK